MSERITRKDIDNVIADLTELTGLTYRHDVSMTWHTLTCDHSRICASNTKKEFYDKLTAIRAQLYMLVSNGMMTKRS